MVYYRGEAHCSLHDNPECECTIVTEAMQRGTEPVPGAIYSHGGEAPGCIQWLVEGPVKLRAWRHVWKADGGDGVIEVYPAASALIWEHDAKEGFDELVRAAGLSFSAESQQRMNQHCRDAVVCALTARAFDLGLIERPDGGHTRRGSTGRLDLLACESFASESASRSMTSGFTDPGLRVGESSVGDFWKWAYSSLADNATRGVFAEYLVGLALDVLGEPRTNWDAADLRYLGHLIEVKSSADNQSWNQDKPSVVRFAAGKKRWWNANTGEWSAVAERPAVVYVFCHFRGAATSDEVVDIGLWDFYPVATPQLDVELSETQSLGLNRLRSLAAPISHADLRAAVDELLAAV